MDRLCIARAAAGPHGEPLLDVTVRDSAALANSQSATRKMPEGKSKRDAWVSRLRYVSRGSFRISQSRT